MAGATLVAVFDPGVRSCSHAHPRTTHRPVPSVRATKVGSGWGDALTLGGAAPRLPFRNHLPRTPRAAGGSIPCSGVDRCRMCCARGYGRCVRERVARTSSVARSRGPLAALRPGLCAWSVRVRCLRPRRASLCLLRLRGRRPSPCRKVPQSTSRKTLFVRSVLVGRP